MAALTTAERDHAVVPGVHALHGVGQPAVLVAVDLGRPRARLGPVSQVGDVVADGPAGRDLDGLPAVDRHDAEERLEGRVRELVAGHEGVQVRRSRVLDERVAVRLPGAEGRGPGLDDREVVGTPFYLM